MRRAGLASPRIWIGELGDATSIALVAAAAALPPPARRSAASVEIRDAVARVTVIPEDRSDVKVEFLTTNADLPLQVRTVGGETIIDGDLDRRITQLPPQARQLRRPCARRRPGQL